MHMLNVVPTFLKILRNDVAEEQWAGRAGAGGSHRMYDAIDAQSI